MLQKGDLGEMMVIREGRRTMPIAWVHQLPATFEGRARMMVQNALAAAAAAHAAGAHLHDIRQGLRSFSTSIYQAPGRLNLFELDGIKVLIDYAHNAPGLRDGRRLRRAHDVLAPALTAGRARRGRRTSAWRSSRRRATGGTRTCVSWGTSPRGTSTRSSSART